VEGEGTMGIGDGCEDCELHAQDASDVHVEIGSGKCFEKEPRWGFCVASSQEMLRCA
jgi:hypothetical protein